MGNVALPDDYNINTKCLKYFKKILKNSYFQFNSRKKKSNKCGCERWPLLLEPQFSERGMEKR